MRDWDDKKEEGLDFDTMFLMGMFDGEQRKKKRDIVCWGTDKRNEDTGRKRLRDIKFW